MRIGIVSDIHGHAAALARAFELMRPVDALVCLGDSISEYRFSNETVALLRAHDVLTLRGNHEDVFYGPLGVATRAADWIDAGHRDWLGAQPAQRRLHWHGRDVLAVHSTAWPPGGDYVCEHDRAFARFGECGADVVLYGHTHLPVVKRVGPTLVINPGSVGESREDECGGAHSCAVLDLERLDATILRYDL